MRGDQVKEKAEIGRKEAAFISEIKTGMERKGLHEKFRSSVLSMFSFRK